jgi:Fe-S cluster assembly protein SufD
LNSMSVLVEKIDVSLNYAGHYNKVKDILKKGSADILNSVRDKALGDFVMQGIPTPGNENYKYTNLQPKFLNDYKFIHQRENIDIDLKKAFKCDVPQLDTYLIFVINGWFYKDNYSGGRLPEGVILESLEKIAGKKPELLKDYGRLAKTEDDPLVALNTAFAKDGYFLYVPKNTVIEKPIQIINFFRDERNAFLTQRNYIYLDEGAKVKLITCDHTLNLNTYLSNSVTEIFAGPDVSLEYYSLQNQHNKSTNLHSVFIKQRENSTVTTVNSSLHGGFIRNNLYSVLNGENATANLFGMAFIDRNQHVDNFTKIIHESPNCQSNQVYKNVLDDNSTGAFTGLIHVLPGAQKTNAFQRNNNLLLTDTATMQTKPQLIIDADDVKCSHGATVGQIDKEALFYLRARGIDETKARLMMMNAFTHEVIQKIVIPPLRKRIDELVERRLRGELAKCHECAYNCEC